MIRTARRFAGISLGSTEYESEYFHPGGII